jgi:hypothetical protein
MTSTIIGSDRLKWRADGDGFGQHVDRRVSAVLYVVPDVTYPGMWRVKFADGSLSDMANLTRAKDGARYQALAILNRGLECQETAGEPPWSERNKNLGCGPPIPLEINAHAEAAP